MNVEAQILKVHDLWKDRDDILRGRVEKLIFSLERMNEYVRNLKRSILTRTIDISLSIIEKIKKSKIKLPENLVVEIINSLKDIFTFDKIIFYINPEDEKILSLFFSNLNIRFDQIIIKSDLHLKRGECYCDYNFRGIKLGIIQKSIDLRNLLIEYFKENSQPSISDKSTSPQDEALENTEEKEKQSVFDLINTIDDFRLVDLLKEEEPRVIAAFLINLKPAKTGRLLLQFQEKLRVLIISELYSIGKISTSVTENMGMAAFTLLFNKSAVGFENLQSSK